LEPFVSAAPGKTAMITVRSILAATDLSPADDRVVRSATALARAFSARLCVVHVAPRWDSGNADDVSEALSAQVARCVAAAAPPSRPGFEGAVPEGSGRARIADRGAGHTERETDGPSSDESGEGRDVDVETDVVYDRPFHGILVKAAAVGADLIVVGTPRGSLLGARWQPTTAERVVRSADVPCFVVREPVALPIRHVGVGVDFRPAARGAERLAVDWLPSLAEGTASRLSLVHVARPEEAPSASALLAAEKGRLEAPGDAGGPAAASDRAGTNDAGTNDAGASESVQIETVVRTGTDVADALGTWAAESGAGLLVVSTTGRRGLRRLVFGSTAAALAAAPPCPVLLVPPAFWRRSPIPLYRIGAAVDGAAGPQPRRWIEDRIARAHRPLELTYLGADGDLVRRSREAGLDLLVVHRDGYRPGTRLDPELPALLERTPIPVLVLRDLPNERVEHVLVAVDTGDIWYEKFGWAKLLAERFGARVTIFHAIDLSLKSRVRREPGGELISGASLWMRDGVEGTVVPAMRSWLWERARLAGLDLSRVDVVVGLQDPWYAIPALAEQTKADLVIVAAHPEGRLGRVPLSPIARATLEGGTYSTLVVVDRAKREAEWSAAARSALRAPGAPGSVPPGLQAPDLRPAEEAGPEPDRSSATSPPSASSTPDARPPDRRSTDRRSTD
jgi:nucleotide-binding universal stress UspA family protein